MKNILKLRLNRHLLSLAMGVGMLGVLIVGNVGTAMASDTPGGTSFQVSGSNPTESVSDMTVSETVSGTTHTYDANSNPFTLDGKDHILDLAMPIAVTDNSGTGNGWKVTIAATSFHNENSQLLRQPSPSVSNVAMTDTYTSDATNTDPIPSSDVYTSNAYVPIPAVTTTATKLYNATAGTGMGEFNLTPTMHLHIQANDYAGTYTSTFTLNLSSGPSLP